MWSISRAFRAAIESPVHTMTVKAQVLDTDFNVVAGGEFYDTGSERHIQRYIVDGQVDADTTRPARRTLTMSLLNPDAEFTPDSEWGGLFYVNRLIRLWRGVRFKDGSEEFAPIGTFMIDTADVIAERNMSIVAITGSDLWKMMAKAQFGRPRKWTEGTEVQTVIKEMAELCGVSRFNFDDLSHRGVQQREIQADISFERGAIVGDEILKLANDWGLDVYFDQMGRLVSQDIRLTESAVWEFKPAQDSSLLTVKASYKDELLYNHVVVTGTKDEGNPVFGYASDTDPTSPTSIDRIGRRTFMYESKYIATTEQAEDVADKLLAKHRIVAEDIELQAVCNPAWEGNDVIRVTEQTFIKVDRRFRIRSFAIPLASSRQTIRLGRKVTL